MSRYTWLLDPGHGGFIDGVYQTAGKRSPMFPDGSQVFEGEFNRDIVRRIIDLSDRKTKVVNLVNTEKDVSLRARVTEANRIHRERKNCVYVSIHANAFGNGKDFNNAKGICTFHHTKSSKGKVLAQCLQKWLVDLTPFRDRGVIANERWANFYVLRKTHMPAILSENGFMTNYDNAKYLMDPEVRQLIANAHYNMMLEIDENGI